MCVKVWRSVSWRKDYELGCKLVERVVAQQGGRLSPSECSHLTFEQVVIWRLN
jgi:hypothetical protein